MTKKEEVVKLRKLSQQYAYASIQMHETIGRKIGLPGTDHKYLGFLIQKGQMTAGELSTLTGLTTGAVTGLIDRFENRKLIRRQFDKSDKRKVIIVPNTEKIIALFEPFYKDFQDNTERLFASFSTEALLILERYFSNALRIMNDKVIEIGKKQ